MMWALKVSRSTMAESLGSVKVLAQPETFVRGQQSRALSWKGCEGSRGGRTARAAPTVTAASRAVVQDWLETGLGVVDSFEVPMPPRVEMNFA